MRAGKRRACLEVRKRQFEGQSGYGGRGEDAAEVGEAVPTRPWRVVGAAED